MKFFYLKNTLQNKFAKMAMVQINSEVELSQSSFKLEIGEGCLILDYT